MEKQKLTNATPVLILGIISILTSCCYGIGLILGIVSLVIAKKDIQLFKEKPELFSNYSSLQTGRILAIIGIILSALMILLIISMISIFGFEGMQNEAFVAQRMRELMGK
jgi:membrane glycosyltransferase